MKGKTRSHLNFESHPLFMVVASLKVLGGLQKCSGMLNVLPVYGICQEGNTTSCSPKVVRVSS